MAEKADKQMTLKEKLMKIQVEMKAPKNLHNSFGNYNYRNAEGILEALKPYETKYKVCTTISDEIIAVGDRVYVKAIASIIDIEKEEMISAVAYAREADSKKGMDDAQVTGATSSYARKYALNGLFLLDDTKDADDETTYLENKKAYMALVSYCTDHGIDITKLCRDRKLTKESTKADFEAALDYAKTL